MKDKHGVEFKVGDIYFYSERNIGDPNSPHADYADSFHEVVEENGELKSKHLLTNFRGEYISEVDAERIMPGSTPWKLEPLSQGEKYGEKECYEIIPAIKREHITKDVVNKVFPLGVRPDATTTIAALKAEHIHNPTTANVLRQQCKDRVSARRRKWSVQKLEKQGEPDYKGGERIDLFYIVDECNETVCDFYSKGIAQREDGCYKLFGFENAKANAERIVACANVAD